MSKKRSNIIFRLTKNITSKAFLLVFGVLLILFNEYILNVIYFRNWAPISLEYRNNEGMVLLIVSDPQIQGYRSEPSFPKGYLSRWDADRYIRRSFSLAFYHTSPDVIVFLGDLMDEGSIATNEEYDVYYERLKNIFKDASRTKKIYVPGDNDIGDKLSNERTSDTISRFERHFGNITGTTKFRFASFFHMDVNLLETFRPEQVKILQQFREKLSMPFRIVLNHEPITLKLKHQVNALLKPIRPHLVISGHRHTASLILCQDCLSEKEKGANYWLPNVRDLTSLKRYVKINPDGNYTYAEIQAPTCSYRMGQPNMGYGVLIINRNGSIKYMTLWVPPRYISLYIYAVYAVYLGIIITDKIFRKSHWWSTWRPRTRTRVWLW